MKKEEAQGSYSGESSSDPRRIGTMSEEALQSLKILYCYAPEDRQWLEEIDLHLSDLKDQCHVNDAQSLLVLSFHG